MPAKKHFTQEQKDAAKAAKRDYCRKWHERNREYLQAKRRAYYVANRERKIKYSAEWYRNNRSRALAACRAWAKANPELRRSIALRHYRIKRERQIIAQLQSILTQLES